MNPSTLTDALAGLHGSSFATLETLTLVRLSGELRNRVFKHARTNVQLFSTSAGYANMVNRRLEAFGLEATFYPKPRAWGNRWPNMPIVQHTNRIYLECVKHAVIDEIFLLDNVPVDSRVIKGHNREMEDSVVMKPQLRDYLTDGIIALTIGGKRYT